MQRQCIEWQKEKNKIKIYRENGFPFLRGQSLESKAGINQIIPLLHAGACP
jgi:hypothetical protein